MKPSMQSRILPHGWMVIGAQVATSNTVLRRYGERDR